MQTSVNVIKTEFCASVMIIFTNVMRQKCVHVPYLTQYNNSRLEPVSMFHRSMQTQRMTQFSFHSWGCVGVAVGEQILYAAGSDLQI